MARHQWQGHQNLILDQFAQAEVRTQDQHIFFRLGILRQQMIAKGRNRDTAMFSMLDGEWPARKAAFERWLAPENFNADGGQKLSLGAINGVSV